MLYASNNPMSMLVIKFGGAAVASTGQFSRIAEIILNRSLNYGRIAVVVSAMGDTTDQLLALAKRVHPEPPRREQDMLVSVGERISISLLAMALHLKGREAISFTGSQSGIVTTANHTDAKIIDVRPFRLVPHLNAGRIVIVAGFQGVSREGEITTLGRGGSDTSAVALGVSLGAAKVEFFKDVPGICNEDPKNNPAAAVFPELSYDRALGIIEKGAEVLHPRAIRLAEKNGVLLHVLSFYDPEMRMHRGTVIGSKQANRREGCFYEEDGEANVIR